MFKIGNVEIKNQIVMAPMAGISNLAYRKIIKEMGAGLVFAEMVSDKAIFYDNQKTKLLLQTDQTEKPIVQQIFGSDQKTMVYAAKYIAKTMQPDIIDINMGCPVPKVAIKSKAGAALMRDEKKAYDLVKAVCEAVDIPVTVKIRSGWDENTINAVAIAKICEKAGAKAITVHPRTRVQHYRGHSDWQIIKQVKQNVTIPVIGNGDVKSCFDAKKMLEETGCDAVMIGRGLLGNPWLVKECITYLQTGEVLKPVSDLAKIKMFEKHFNYLKTIKPLKVAILEMRMFGIYYLKKIPNTKDLKLKIVKMNTKTDIEKLIKEYKERLQCNT